MRKAQIFRNKLLLVLGITLAMIIVFQGVHQFQFEESVSKTELKESSEDAGEEDTSSFVDINHEFIASSILNSPSFESFEIMEIILNDEEESVFQLDVFIDSGELFKILFQKVISANAP